MDQKDDIIPDEDPLDEDGESESSERKHNKATARVLRVLSAFACDEESFGVTELSKRLGLTKNLVFRALSTLVDEGYLVRDEGGNRYQLGFRIVELLNHATPPMDFRTLAAPYLMDLHELTGETVQLVIKIKDCLTVIDGIVGRGPVISRPRIGMPLPLHASAASRAILSSLPDAEIDDYLARNAPLERFTEHTLTEPDEIWREIRLVREQGYALGYEDYNRGNAGLAFAIRDAEGYPHGAVVIGGPVERFPNERMMKLMPGMRAIVDDLAGKARLYYTDC